METNENEIKQNTDKKEKKKTITKAVCVLSLIHI